jgi:hypothetical protein
MTITLIVDGAHEFSLTDGTYTRLIGHDGWGSPGVNRHSISGPLQDGDTDRGQNLKPRYGKLFFVHEETDLDGMYEKRKNVLDLFGPGANLQLRFDMPYGQRQFDVVFYDELQMEWGVKSWAAQKFAVVLKANNPTCYDPNRHVVTWVGEVSGGGIFTIPSFVPTFFGSDSFSEIKEVQYPGNWEAKPEIEIVGPIDDFVITNLSSGDSIDFFGLDLPALEKRIIDLRYGAKPVVDEDGVNAIGDVTDASDLATFGLLPKRPWESFRSNAFQVSGANFTSATRVFLRYYDRFTGV